MKQPTPSRRDVLHFLAGVPLLPLAPGLAAAGALVGCGGSDTATLSGVSFTSMPAPTLASAAAMATMTVASSMVSTYSDGSSDTWKLGYRPFFMTGDMVPNGKGGTILAGGYYNIANQPIMDASVAGKERQFFSDAPDGMSLLKLPSTTVPGIKGNAVFAVVQFEYTSRDNAGVSAYGLLPSPSPC